ncbi:MAG: ATP-binding cassette domain-containing protein [Deltaproteobacteria bacterium]|nr:ATP-binding cassette domain-containing protein [Deltaproteobacteria bacterium]MBT4264056.1 ATP-binding cassette domain-containing protein [Deltaproteobacteria bacterium]MBT4640656.1 ATP-binding cassette domain-containing protein [Deltaproteobacteria bacterium]MBT6505083.1 ATP-binding cassette domain-containing protein [Deltaproteobacteria bacterium]MBT7716563.1 ATP-binding cassette domain-containing protein [Deltaproteobacteria bacterium]
MSIKPLITFRKVKKSFLGKEPLFSDINLEISEGEFIFLTGVSGAGKSTLFRLLLGLEKPDDGSIKFNGSEVTSLVGKEMLQHRRSIGMIFQDYKLLEKRTAEDNIAIPLQIKGISRSVKSAKIKDITHKLKISQILKQQVRSLSGGEQQLIAIARAAVHSPTLILADEPTANLDPRMATRIFDMLTLLNEEGMTVVVATHDINLLKAHKKRILLLKQSALIEVH